MHNRNKIDIQKMGEGRDDKQVIKLMSPYGGSGHWKSTFIKDSTTLFKQITGGYFLYQHVEN